LAVNGVRVNSELTHSQVLSLLRNSGEDFVELELGYNLNGPEMGAQANGRGIEQKTTEIELKEEEEEGEGSTMFGMTLRGGAYGPDAQKSRPLTVTAIRVGGAAHREGRLRLGDRVVAVNGVSQNYILGYAFELLLFTFMHQFTCETVYLFIWWMSIFPKWGTKGRNFCNLQYIFTGHSL
jgi:hypothetical protein